MIVRRTAKAREGPQRKHPTAGLRRAANLRTEILDFREIDSSSILILRGGILRPIGDFPEMLSQQILAGIILVGRLGDLRP